MRLGHSIVGDDKAPLVVFVHGFLGSSADWRGTVDALRDEYRCLAIDLPGHAASVASSDEEYTMLNTATAILDLIDSLNVASFSLVAYSMGGRVALYLASIYAMRIDALVIESASPGLRTKAERDERLAQDERWARMLEEERIDAFLDAWYAQPLFATLSARPELMASIKTIRTLNDPRELARTLRGLSVGNQLPLWDEWRETHIPSLIVAGELDPKYCAIAREMRETCSVAKLAIIPGAGHNVHAEAPGEYNRVIHSFLNDAILGTSQKR